jgi:putative methionine-R-sulfoxide reductase with GAF domain
MFGSAQPEANFPLGNGSAAPDGSVADGAVPRENSSNLERQELDAALQLLVERAQYITGATAAALALTQGEHMVCRASAGKSGPAIGAQLQVRSGLSGESIARKQLLRCDNAETDPRVNIETCRQLGIASIVVLPLLTRSGEVRGVFELFSDHAHAFEERDLIALERMADLTMTALDLADRKPRVVSSVIVPETVPEPSELQENKAEPASVAPILVDMTQSASSSPSPQVRPAEAPKPLPSVEEVQPVQVQENQLEPLALAVPEAMRRVQKCASCGFPVSEGRSLCVDCENKHHLQPESNEATTPQFVPAFLNSSPPPKESWFVNNINVLAVAVLILSVLVFVVVFR